MKKISPSRKRGKQKWETRETEETKKAELEEMIHKPILVLSHFGG